METKKITIRFKSEDEYKDAREKYEEYRSHLNAWLKENKTNAIPAIVSETFPHHNYSNHSIVSAIEEYEFRNNKFENYTVYINEQKRTATTWTGQKLGDVTYTGAYKSNFRDERITISIKAINGQKYFGTYYKSAGDYARIKLCKNQS